MNLRRSPDGRFIAPEAALEAWLPTMLDWIFCSPPITRALLLLAVYCDRMAARSWRWYANAIEENDQSGTPQAMKRNAERLMEQAALIREVAEKCR